MIEVLGDSARGADFALVRLRIDGDRIVDADGDGLERPLRGLTLLEAAAVRGETLAAGARSSIRSCRATRKARPRTRAFAATAASDSPSCSRSRAAPARLGSLPVTTRASSNIAGVRCSRAQ